jgi:hypothetical protein
MDVEIEDLQHLNELIGGLGALSMVVSAERATGASG